MVPELSALDTQELRLRIVTRLGTMPDIDYEKTWATICRNRAEGSNHRAAGVLLLMSGPDEHHNYVSFHLIKRARLVSQGGDISCPGGMLDPRTDRILMAPIRSYLLPVMTGPARAYAQQRGKATFELIMLFLATALRETWEEIGLYPWHIRFLGPLPTYTLSLFPRTIFPLVAWVTHPGRARPNREVEKILRVPLNHFFDRDNYTRFAITSHHDPTYHRESLAFVIHGEDGTQEILWGATFNIIMTFLKYVFDFAVPAIPHLTTHYRMLSADYLTGDRAP